MNGDLVDPYFWPGGTGAINEDSTVMFTDMSFKLSVASPDKLARSDFKGGFICEEPGT